MATRSRRRLVLYALAVAVAGGLLWGVLVWAPSVPPDVATLVNAAEFQLVEFGLHEKALADVRRALEQDPDHPYAHVLGARACEGLGRHDEALAFYARAVDLYPDEARRRDLRVSALRVLLAAGRYDELETRARDLLAGGASPSASYALGRALEIRGDDAGALAAYDLVVPSPDVPDARRRAAAILGRTGRGEEGIRMLESELARSPDRASVEDHLLLARLRLEAGDRDGAAAALAGGARLDPLRIRGELRQNEVWNPLKKTGAVAPLLKPAPARAPE